MISGLAENTSATQDPLVVWLGNPFFSPSLENQGWRVVREWYTAGTIYTWDSILVLTRGEIPDVVVIGDTSTPPILLGMERFPCLTIFYAVDAHIHGWYPVYAQGFDLCLVSLKEFIPNFITGRLDSSSIWWFPPYIPDHLRPLEPSPEPEWDLLFVGTVKPEVAPARALFLQKLQAIFPGLHITSGDFTRLFPKARLVLNECTRGELNFRVFEALGCGACLLTPDIGPALTELFTPGKELFVYPSHDAEAVAKLAATLLADKELRIHTAHSGLAAVDAKHRESARAKNFTKRVHALLHSGQAKSMIEQRKESSRNILVHALRLLYLHHAETVDNQRLRDIYLKAARSS